MSQLTIKLTEQTGADPCPLCGTSRPASEGPQLFVEDRAVCRDCGQRHAPHLAALIDLANIAERVGRTSRYIMTPPMEALLALARAAEDYTFSTFKSSQKAA